LPVVAWAAAGLRWLEALAGSWWGAPALFVVALADYGVQAVAWPLRAGPNLDEYLLTYIQLLDRHPLLPWAPLFRGPGAGVVVGPLLGVDGGALAEPGAAVLYAISIVAWSAAALAFGRRAAILTACALLLYPGYAGLFHELASEIAMATMFSLWALAIVCAAKRPSVGRFAVVGFLTAALVLIRPGNSVLLPFALFPLLIARHWRERLAWTAAFAGTACLTLLALTLQNGWRYGDYALARGGNAVVPFYRVFVTDKLAAPGNGPASRRLAAAISQHLLTRNPYKARHVTLAQVFSGNNARVDRDLYVLSDQAFGWDSAYSTLRSAAVEAIEAHPGSFASDVADTVWQELYQPAYSSQVPQTPPPPPNRHVAGRTRATQADQGQLIPGGQKPWISRPDQRIREVWTSATTHRFVVANPSQRAHLASILRNLDQLLTNFPHRAGIGWLQLRLNTLARWYPPPILWLLVALIAAAIRRPRGTATVAMLAIPALTIITLNALGHAAQTRYMLPIAPAFVLVGAAALLGKRQPKPPNHPANSRT
jgi:hypothetical protein